MAYIRRLKSGKWQATVRLPNGKRRSESDKLKSVVAGWAADLEQDTRRGDVIDPRAGETTVAQLRDRFGDGRRLEAASRRRDESHWRNHVAPQWGRWPAAAITRPDVTAWVEQMEQDEIGAWTIAASLNLLRALLEAAVDARIIRANPAVGVSGPTPPDHLDRVLTPDEDDLLLFALDRVADRPDGRLFGELLLYCGLRWEEAAAVDRDHVDLRGRLLHIGPVVERNGRIRPYPKTRAGKRTVPVPDELWPAVRARAMEVGPGGLLVPAPRGGVLGYTTWRSRVWVPALEGAPERPRVRGHAHRPAITGAGLADPQPTPHDLRHTYGTRLAEDRVPPYEIMALMGHATLASVQRYIHPGDVRHDRARAAMRRAGSTQDERHTSVTSA